MTGLTASRPAHSTTVGAGTPEPHLVSLVAPSSFEAEQYRMLRHVIENKRRDTGLCTVGVTSPEEGEGKTTTAINLAGALAQNREARVLLIDADLRQPSIAQRLRMPRAGAGLVTAILDPSRAPADLISVDRRFNLAILPAGPHHATPYELLKSPALGVFLQALREVFDYIVIDTAPVMPCPDPRLVEPWLDGFLVVVKAHKTPKARRVGP